LFDIFVRLGLKQITPQRDGGPAYRALHERSDLAADIWNVREDYCAYVGPVAGCVGSLRQQGDTGGTFTNGPRCYIL